MPDPTVLDPGSPQSINVPGGTPPPVPTIPQNPPGLTSPELPLSSGAKAAMPPVATLPAPAVAPQQSKGSMMGKLASSLFNTMNTRETQWQPDANGEMQPVAGPKMSGTSIFKHILAGAILGGASAQQAHAENPYMGAGGGAVAGAAGVQKHGEQMTEKAKEDAQRAYQLQQQKKLEEQRLSLEEKREKNQETMNMAQMHRWTAEDLQNSQILDLQNKERMDRINAQGEMMLKEVLQAHGHDAQIPFNGQMGNGEKMVDYFNKHPDQLNPADKAATRMSVKTVNTDGLNYDGATGSWKDDKGQKVSLESRTTWHVYDVPMDAANQTVAVSGKQLKNLFPSGIGANADPKATYQIPLGTLISIGASERAEQRAGAREDHRYAQEQIGTTVRALDSDISALETELRSSMTTDEREGGKESPGTVALRTQIQEYIDRKDKVLSTINPALAEAYRTDKAARDAAAAARGKAAPGKVPAAGAENSGLKVKDVDEDFLKDKVGVNHLAPIDGSDPNDPDESVIDRLNEMTTDRERRQYISTLKLDPKFEKTIPHWRQDLLAASIQTEARPIQVRYVRNPDTGDIHPITTQADFDAAIASGGTPMPDTYQPARRQQ